MVDVLGIFDLEELENVVGNLEGLGDIVKLALELHCRC